jgi:hypothetical protein
MPKASDSESSDSEGDLALSERTKKKKDRKVGKKKKSKISKKIKKKKSRKSGDKRTFTVLTLNGTEYGGGSHGYYKSRTPSAAASKAATRFFRSGDGDTTKKVIVVLKEITAKGAGKCYSYSVRRR